MLHGWLFLGEGGQIDTIVPIDSKEFLRDPPRIVVKLILYGNKFNQKMLFSQPLMIDRNKRTRRLTMSLIDSLLIIGGRIMLV